MEVREDGVIKRVDKNKIEGIMRKEGNREKRR